MENKLEEYVVTKLRKLDSKARRTKASGASTELADILNQYFYVECKSRNTTHCKIDRSVMLKLLRQRAKKEKWCLYILENQFKDRYVVMDADEFFELLKRGLNG